QAEDGIRDFHVTGVQTCALPISRKARMPLVSYLVQSRLVSARDAAHAAAREFGIPLIDLNAITPEREVVMLVQERLIRRHQALRSEERRVGKGGRSSQAAGGDKK